MKTLFFLLFLSANVVFAQSKTEYEQILQRGKDALVKEDYKTAILKYRAAEAADPSKKEDVNILIDAVFVAIEAKRKQVEKEASLQTQKASLETEKALKETQKQKNITDIALAKTNKLINPIYFFYDMFALVYKKRR